MGIIISQYANIRIPIWTNQYYVTKCRKICSSEWPIRGGFLFRGLFKGVGWSPGFKDFSRPQLESKDHHPGSIFIYYVLVGELVLLVGWKTITIKTSMFVVRFHFLCMGRRSCFQSLQSWEFVGIRYFPNSARTKKYGLIKGITKGRGPWSLINTGDSWGGGIASHLDLF